MNRSIIDKLISTTGAVVVVVLVAASGALFYAHHFIHTQVYNQLSAQKITFPAAGSSSLGVLPATDKTVMDKYAGQQLTSGAQAQTFADHFIAVHLKEIGGGQTYAQLSAASLADPSNQKLVVQVQTVFRGETLRGLLLNAYAFDTMATVALYAAYGALIAAAVLLVLVVLGYWHAGKSAQAAKTTKRRR